MYETTRVTRGVTYKMAAFAATGLGIIGFAFGASFADSAPEAPPKPVEAEAGQSAPGIEPGSVNNSVERFVEEVLACGGGTFVLTPLDEHTFQVDKECN